MIEINKMLKPAIISISLITVMAAGAISPALHLIAAAFPHTTPTMIKLILTGPSLTIIPFSFISSYLVNYMSKRNLLLLGISIYIIGGVGGQFAHAIWLLLILRLLLGAGVGLILPLSMSLINDYYTGNERTRMMGYNTAFSNFGGILTIVIAGFLATFGWRIPFNVYLMGFVIMVLVFFFIPNERVEQEVTETDKKGIPWIVYVYALGMSMIMIAYFSIPTNMALFLEENQLGESRLAGMIISFTTIGGMTTSLLLVQIQSAFKEYTITIMLIGMGLAFTFLSFTNSIPLIMISVCLIGFGQGSLFPIIILKALNSVEPNHSERVVAITSSFIFLGQFLSPVVLELASSIFNQPTIRFQFTFLAISFFVYLSVTFALNIRKFVHSS